jgi:hypothetical protein
MSNGLTPEQAVTIAELQMELRDLQLEADARWKQYIKTGSRECFESVLALDSEVEMKALIAHIPKAGEVKVGRVRTLIDKLKRSVDKDCPECDLPESIQARINTLATINDWRDSFGLPLLDRMPQGLIGDPAECTIARAVAMGWENLPGKTLLEVNISGDSFHIDFEDDDGKMERVDLTEWSTDAWGSVIEGFDSHRYIDLMEDTPLVNATIEHLIECALRDDPRTHALLVEVQRRGLVERLCVEFGDDCGERLEYGDGEFRLADSGVNQALTPDEDRAAELLTFMS